MATYIKYIKAVIHSVKKKKKKKGEVCLIAF